MQDTEIMGRPKVLVFSGYGLNSEEETKFAFDWAGGSADIIHINDIIDRRYSFSDYQILVLPGGFAYGDDTGSGNAYALKFRNHLWKELIQFIKKDRLIIGICNGFQILMNLGLIPALHMEYGKREMGLMPNASARYVVRFVDLRNDSKINSPWLDGIKSLSIPVANGEGRLMTSPKVLNEINKKGLVAFRYYEGPMSQYQNLPYNPNGSIEDIAGVSDETGRIIGLMPHPERAIFFVQLPNWPLLKEQYKRKDKKIPKEGPGLSIFRNAIRYFS